jgi:lysozyme
LRACTCTRTHAPRAWRRSAWAPPAISTAAPQVVALCPGVDTPGRLAAITDFAFNVGTGALRASTLRRRVNAGAWDDVPAQLMRWVFAAGKRLRGLERRRAAEAALI